MKKTLTLIIITLLLFACKKQPQFIGYVVDNNLIIVEDLGPISHVLENIPVGSVVQMQYDGVIMESYPMQIDNSAKFTIIETKEHIITTISHIILELQQFYDDTSNLNVEVVDLDVSDLNILPFILSSKLSTIVNVSEATTDAKLSITFKTIDDYGKDRVEFEVRYHSQEKEVEFLKSYLELIDGLYEVHLY